MMQPLQFRNFVFPSNPTSITLERKNRVLAHFCPGQGDMLEHLGSFADKIICQGAFWSESVAQTSQQIDAFLAAAKEQEKGLLFTPFGAPVYCYLGECAIQGKGDGRVVPYTLVFLVEGGGSFA